MYMTQAHNKNDIAEARLTAQEKEQFDAAKDKC